MLFGEAGREKKRWLYEKKSLTFPAASSKTTYAALSDGHMVRSISRCGSPPARTEKEVFAERVRRLFNANPSNPFVLIALVGLAEVGDTAAVGLGLKEGFESFPPGTL